MPTYEYICDACQYEFEKFQSIKSDPIAVCPECAKAHVRRKISGGAAILFKGGGFYETDYRSAGYNEAKKKDTADGGAAKPETKSDAPATTSKPTKSESAKSDAPTSDASKSEAKLATPAKAAEPKSP